MTTVYEAERIINDAAGALNGIVGAADRFVRENVASGVLGGGWKDVCGATIGNAVVSSVSDAVYKNLNLYDCVDKLEKIASDIQPLIAAIEGAQKELQ